MVFVVLKMDITHFMVLQTDETIVKKPSTLSVSQWVSERLP
jgi:hypothetical protein